MGGFVSSIGCAKTSRHGLSCLIISDHGFIIKK